MKHGKNPTKAQKCILSYYRLNYDNWLVTKSTDKELFIVHRFTDSQRVLKKVRIEPENKKKVNKYA